jgi:hypothetical protein
MPRQSYKRRRVNSNPSTVINKPSSRTAYIPIFLHSYILKAIRGFSPKAFYAKQTQFTEQQKWRKPFIQNWLLTTGD